MARYTQRPENALKRANGECAENFPCGDRREQPWPRNCALLIRRVSFRRRVHRGGQAAEGAGHSAGSVPEQAMELCLLGDEYIYSFTQRVTGIKIT